MGYKKWFVKHIFKEKLLFLVMLIFLILFVGTVSFTPLLIGDIFDELAKSNRDFQKILLTSLFIAIAGLIRMVGDYLQSYTNEVIAHRLTTIKNSDRILVLDHGELVEQGDHDSLMSEKGLYSELYETYFKHQSAEWISEISDVFTE